MRISSVAVVCAAAFVSGCAVKNTLHVHPATGEIRGCSASGWGWIGTPMALAMHGSCKDSLRSIGYIPLDDVQPGVLTIETDPPGAQLFAGPTDKDLRPMGKSPVKLFHPQRSRSWVAECYQAKLAGYKDSEIDCRAPIWGDRSVSLKLTQ